MILFDIFRKPTETKSATVHQSSFVQQESKARLLVTAELDKALEECKAKVARISKDCRMMNRKYRDNEFDLENDRELCLHGLFIPGSTETYAPSDVQRVTQIFENPQFFVDGANADDIVQGAIGDCWFVSALATMTTTRGLVEKFCVAKDEEIGVYGFIFFRDASWVTVIIDDFLYTINPKYEELSYREKALYHSNKEIYNATARKSGKGTPNETWVPLIEKAYAKLHGSYAALSGGEACEAIEDLTGYAQASESPSHSSTMFYSGVSTFIPTSDILDIDRFWNEELLKANQDRLFGCSFDGLDGTRSGDYNASISGLIGDHAYSVLRAVEVKGKRFVVLRNPWGRSEWTGPWGDGSKEWTKEWLDVLPLIGHSFGDDGQFVMEYKDLLENWKTIDRTLLFDSSWIMSFQWLHVTTKPFPTAWSFGEVSFTFSLPKASPAMIVLSELDTRFFEEISSRWNWTFDFVVFRKGEKEYLAHSAPSRLWSRSVNLELNLDAGEYVVHDFIDKGRQHWDERTFARVLSARTEAQSIAANFKPGIELGLLPLPLSILAGQDLAELEEKALAKKKEEEIQGAQKAENAEQKAEEDAQKGEETEKKAEEGGSDNKTVGDNQTTTDQTEDGNSITIETTTAHQVVNVTERPANSEEVESDVSDDTEDAGNVNVPADSQPNPKRDLLDVSDGNSIFLGIRVYTNKESSVEIKGQLRHEMEVSAELLLAS
ncbi:hypothetical protein F5880DRAFT_1502696 [Lentinula raphanica]|nr:hypothetical protein F5880DRAFT_1502696 [Lentinula raphanica]